jgi:hypothetical protein
MKTMLLLDTDILLSARSWYRSRANNVLFANVSRLETRGRSMSSETRRSLADNSVDERGYIANAHRYGRETNTHSV